MPIELSTASAPVSTNPTRLQTTVLIAERDPEVARQLSNAASAQGWDTIHARDAAFATAAVIRQRPSAVVLGAQLPGGGAGLTIRRLRASVHTAMIPVVAFTGLEAGEADALRQQGADACIPNPPDIGAVIGWIRTRLETPVRVTEAPGSLVRDADRLASLDRTGLLDSAPTEPFDTLTRVASAVLGVPVALVSLVDRNRQFFKSHTGLPEPWATRRETPLTHSFCQWVVSDHDALSVSDAREHPVLRDNRALHELGVIAYAGMPLTSTSGDAIGSFCAIDTKPHIWSGDDIVLLRQFSLVAEGCIAVAEYDTSTTQSGPETSALSRSLVIRAVGVGVSNVSGIMSRDTVRLGPSERTILLELMEWLGKQVVRLVQ